MTEDLDRLRTHLHDHFAAAGITAEPDIARVTFLGAEPIEVLRFGPGPDGFVHYVSVGCSRHPMTDPTAVVADPHLGPRAEVVLTLRGPVPDAGLARGLAVLAAAPAVEGVVLTVDALLDLGEPLWPRQSAFTAVLLGHSDIDDLEAQPPREPVRFMQATPITATEAAWVRLKGPDEMREAWRADGVDVLDPDRRASRPS